MAIKTHADLKTAAREAITFWRALAAYQDACLKQWSQRTVSDCNTCWRALCRKVDQVVYAAGGHRDHLTWHLYGGVLTAEDLWGVPGAGDVQYGKDLPSFLLYGGLRSTADTRAYAIFWAESDKRLPRPKARGDLSPPFIEGRSTEEQIHTDEEHRKHSVFRLQRFSKRAEEV
jgi:hypothetical protein